MSGARAPMSVGSTKVSFDRPHAGFPSHADMVTKLPNGMAQKLRVDGQGGILSGDIVVSTRSKFQR